MPSQRHARTALDYTQPAHSATADKTYVTSNTNKGCHYTSLSTQRDIWTCLTDFNQLLLIVEAYLTVLTI